MAAGTSEKSDSHFSAVNYIHEFQRSRRLIGEIPRKTILRHLFIMGAPFLSVEVMNKRLAELGYAPLTKNHETRWGERLDHLVICLLEHLESECAGKSPEECKKWLYETCRAIDSALAGTKYKDLRFLYFKSLKGTMQKC